MPFYAGQKLRAGDLGQLSTSAQYSGASSQTITTATDTVVAFATADFTTSYVTRTTTGAGHLFTLLVGGLWMVSTTVRWSTTGASATGEKACHAEDNLGEWLFSSSIPASTTTPVTHMMSTTKYFAAGATVQVEVFQNSGGSEDLEQSAIFGTPRINFTMVLAS